MKTIKMMFKEEDLVGEYTVSATPPVCLGRTRSFFESVSWPYRDNSTVYGPDLTGRIVSVRLPGHLFMGSCLGILLIITLGTFFLIWAIIAFLVYAELGPSVTVSAVPTGENVTRITVTTNSAEHAEPVIRWLEQELEAERVNPVPHTPGVAADSTDQEVAQRSIQEPVETRDEVADTPDTTVEPVEGETSSAPQDVNEIQALTELGQYLGQVPTASLTLILLLMRRLSDSGSRGYIAVVSAVGPHLLYLRRKQLPPALRSSKGPPVMSPAPSLSVLALTGANTDSIGLEVRRCLQCSAG